MSLKGVLYLSSKDVAALLGISYQSFNSKRQGMEEQGFPMPLPWNKRKRLYHRCAVEAWKQRQEALAKCLPNHAAPLTLVRPHSQEAAR